MKVDYEANKIPERRRFMRKSRAYDIMHDFLESSNAVARICEFKDKKELRSFYGTARTVATRRRPEFATIKIHMQGDAVYLEKTEGQE
ncbi:hypothetical protein [Beduinella massiliensis]|uniref:hypothetical protein n=1 Tax=Beduinella massiliensis TaxID=1852363 RepID=UPI000C830415